MIKYHLTITIFNAFFEGKLTPRGKIDSVWFYDYDILMDKILHELSYSDITKFKLNLFECYKNDLSCIRVSQFVNGDVIDGYSIISSEFNVTSNIIARCIPSRKVRDRYFDYDCVKERYYVRTDFIFYLKK